MVGTIVNRYDMTCDMRFQIGMLRHRYIYKAQIKGFNFIGIMALISFAGGFWMKSLWYMAIIFGVAFLIYRLWVKSHMLFIKKEFSQNARFYPVEKVFVKCDDKIRIIIDESKHTETYDYSMVCDIKETKDLMVLLMYTTEIAFVKRGAGTMPEQLTQIKTRCRNCKRKGNYYE